ncbi:hypothetical cytosolic protein [Syntrophus aciditrophicus SB]|uniref:Hypothetical cytosolic protein n=1 Tax=Syntrophus aciditrophicus (strain SB) TaxID=56780 RepID=Q2LPG7_SYNAS|nr:hypothetical cytosolic protein [Syntrophus aciditrophicus SB]
MEQISFLPFYIKRRGIPLLFPCYEECTGFDQGIMKRNTESVRNLRSRNGSYPRPADGKTDHG